MRVHLWNSQILWKLSWQVPMDHGFSSHYSVLLQHLVPDHMPCLGVRPRAHLPFHTRMPCSLPTYHLTSGSVLVTVERPILENVFANLQRRVDIVGGSMLANLPSATDSRVPCKLLCTSLCKSRGCEVNGLTTSIAPKNATGQTSIFRDLISTKPDRDVILGQLIGA